METNPQEIYLKVVREAVIEACQNRNFSLTPPLTLACRTRDIETVKQLLQTVKQLLEKGAQISFHDRAQINFHDPVVTAAETGDDQILQLLINAIKNAATIEAPPLEQQLRDASTKKALNVALHCASHNGYPACVKILLEARADWRTQDNDGKTPLDRARERLETADSQRKACYSKIENLLESAEEQARAAEEQARAIDLALMRLSLQNGPQQS